MSTSNKYIQYKTRGGGGGERKGGVIINFTDCSFSGDYMHMYKYSIFPSSPPPFSLPLLTVHKLQ